MTCNESELFTLRGAAVSWRKDNGHADQNGVVLIWAGEVYGWKNELRNPESEGPGAFAVDSHGVVYEARGGNDYDGAERWEALKP